MNVNYHKWLDIEITHNYFNKGVSSVFGLIPMQETSKLLHNFNVLLNQQQHIHSLFAGVKNGNTFDITEQFQGISNLYFQLTVDDPLFFNYTNLNANTIEPLLYFSNSGNQTSGKQLHPGNVVSNNEFVNSRPGRFNITIPSGETTLEIKTATGIVVIEQQLSNPTDVNYPIDLSQQEDGAYELYINSELQEKFFKSSEALASNTIGVVHLQMDSIINNYEDGLMYKIDFDARSMFWRYKIVIPASRNIEVTHIEIKGISAETYDGPVDEQIVGGQTAKTFTSSIPMPLQQQLEKFPQLSMSYTGEFSNRATELELKLPNPGAENISKNNNGESDDSFFSSTIIYV